MERALGQPASVMPLEWPAGEKLFVLKVESGLTNRMRALISAQYLAEKSGRKFVLIWPFDVHCPARFSSLFETPICQIEYQDNLFEGMSCVHIRDPRQIKRGVDIYNEQADVILFHSSWYLFDPTELNLGEFNYFIRWDKIPVWEKATHAYAVNKLRPYLNGLIPVESIRYQVQSFVDAYFDGYMYGVHVRRTDHVPARHSKLKHFIFKMDCQLDRQPDTRFFLATDNERCERLFKARYGKRMMTFPKKYRRDRKRHTSMEAALIDLLLLSKTQYILGSFRSSFSMLAAVYNNIPCEIA